MKQTKFLVVSYLVASVFVFFACKQNEILPPITEEEDPFVILIVENVGKTTARLSAQIIPNSDSVFISFQYASRNSQSWKTHVFAENISGDAWVIKALDLDSLTPGTSYKFRVLANKIVTEEKWFNTFPIDKAKIFTYSVENTKKTTTTVRAHIVAGIEDSATVEFKYSVKGSNNWQTIVIPQKFFGLDTIKLSLDLSDLKENTRYSFRWEVANGGGVAIKEDSAFTYAVSDFNGNLYHTIAIGGQTWLMENFKGTHFANGDPIPNVTKGEEWSKLTTPAYCWYNNDPEIGKIYGGLYNWWVSVDSRELILGFKTPITNDFVELAHALGYIDGTFGPMIMDNSNKYWLNTSKKLTNSTDFTAMPNGVRDYTRGDFMYLHKLAILVTKSERGDTFSSVEIEEDCIVDIGYQYPKVLGAGIRLLKTF